MSVVRAAYLFALCLGFCHPVLAQAQDVSAASPAAAAKVPELLNYQKLMALTPERREAYLEGLRSILVEIGQISAEKGDDMIAGEARELRGRYFALQALLSVAGAQQGDSASAPAGNSAAPTAGPAAPAEVAIEAVVPRFNGTGFFMEKWVCDAPKSKAGAPLAQFDYEVGTCVQSSHTTCEEGKAVTAYLANRVGRPRKFCIPKASWDALPVARRVELAREAGASSVRGNFALQWRSASAPRGQETVFAQTATAVEAPLVLSRASAGVISGASGCTAGDFTCDTPWSDRRKAYYDDPAVNTCVFSGNVSSFIEGRKAPGRCKPVFEMRLSASLPMYRCLNRSETLCNPLVFGVSKDEGRPFCVPAKAHATRECNALSTTEARQPDFLAKNISGMQESWTSFREGFNKLCKTNEASRKFHCEECRVMSQRLVELNAKVANEICSDLKEASALPTAPATAPGAAPSGAVDSGN